MSDVAYRLIEVGDIPNGAVVAYFESDTVGTRGVFAHVPAATRYRRCGLYWRMLRPQFPVGVAMRGAVRLARQHGLGEVLMIDPHGVLRLAARFRGSGANPLP